MTTQTQARIEYSALRASVPHVEKATFDRAASAIRHGATPEAWVAAARQVVAMFAATAPATPAPVATSAPAIPPPASVTEEEIDRLLGRPSDLAAARVGSVIWWSCPGGIKINALKLRRALDRFAPDFADAMKLETSPPLTAIRRAVRRRQSSRATRKRATFWRETHETTDEIRIAFVREDLGAEAYRARGTFEITICKNTGAHALSRQPGEDDEKQALDLLLERYRMEREFLTAEDVTAGVAKILTGNLGALRVKRGGSVYFLPKDRDEEIVGIARAFSFANCGLKIRWEEVADRNAEQYAEETTLSLLDACADLSKRCEERLTAAKKFAEGGCKRPSKPSFQARIDEAEDIETEARLLKSLLGGATDEVEAALAGARALLDEAEREITTARR